MCFKVANKSTKFYICVIYTYIHIYIYIIYKYIYFISFIYQKSQFLQEKGRTYSFFKVDQIDTRNVAQLLLKREEPSK